MNYYYQREFSKDIINQIIISESTYEEVLSEAANILAIYGNFFTDFGNSINNFTNECNTCGSKIASIIRREGLNSKSEKEIIHIFEEFVQKSSEAFLDPNKIRNKANNMGLDIEKVNASVKVFLVVIIVNSIMDLIFRLLIGPPGSILTAIIVAPIVEEISKAIAIKGDFAVEYTIIFNSYEFTDYVLRYGKVIGFAKMIVIRLKCVLFHLTTTILQWFTLNKDILSKCGINPEDRETVNFVGRILAIFMHGTWNFLAIVVRNKKQS